MTAPRGAIRNLLESGLALVALGPLLLMPPRVAVLGLRALGSVLFWCLPGRRAHARRRVQQTLGMDVRAADRVVHGAFRNLATNAMEALRLERALRRGGVEQLVAVEGAEHLQAALDRGQGVVLAGAHLGAWEAIPVIVAKLFKPLFAVARPLDNPLLERMLKGLRGEVLAGTLDKDGSARDMARLMRKNEMVGMLLDQNAGSAGLMLPFLGLPSRQHRVAGVMGTRFGAAVLPMYMLREPGCMRFRLLIEPAVSVPEGLSPEDAERELVLAVSRSLERQVMEHPEQWNWLHDRWHSAEVALFLERQQRERTKSGPGPALAESTNGSR
ncbi:MAG: hypothetical protein DRQ55_04705 [Planctomycetota bacterium]|nr:MAG: hypothetical protein DRQ55_04705 [Planctomycetota bacterium]